MPISCEFHATAREAVGRKHVEYDAEDAPTLRAVLDAIDADGLVPIVFDSDGDIRPHVNVLVNGESVGADGGTQTLADGDEITVMPAVAGGR